MLPRISGFSVLGFMMVSSKLFVVNEMFQLYEGSLLHNLSCLQEFPVS